MDDRDKTVGSVANPPLPRSLRGVPRRITTANLLGYLHALTRPSTAARRRWGSRGGRRALRLARSQGPKRGQEWREPVGRIEASPPMDGQDITGLYRMALLLLLRDVKPPKAVPNTRLGEVLVCYGWGAEFIYQSRAPGAWGGTGFRSHQPPRAGSWRRRLRARTTRQGSRPPHRTSGFSRRPADRSRC